MRKNRLKPCSYREKFGLIPQSPRNTKEISKGGNRNFGIFVVTTKGSEMIGQDWERFREVCFAILDGEEKTGMTYEEYKKQDVVKK
jgi:hypothetical protein